MGARSPAVATGSLQELKKLWREHPNDAHISRWEPTNFNRVACPVRACDAATVTCYIPSPMSARLCSQAGGGRAGPATRMPLAVWRMLPRFIDDQGGVRAPTLAEFQAFACSAIEAAGALPPVPTLSVMGGLDTRATAPLRPAGKLTAVAAPPNTGCALIGDAHGLMVCSLVAAHVTDTGDLVAFGATCRLARIAAAWDPRWRRSSQVLADNSSRFNLHFLGDFF